MRVPTISVVPAKRPAGTARRGARAGTHAAACRGGDGSRLFAPVACLRRLRPLGRDDTSGGRDEPYPNLDRLPDKPDGRGAGVNIPTFTSVCPPSNGRRLVPRV